jgi:hypothetical protein
MLLVGCIGEKGAASENVVTSEEKPEVINVDSIAPEPELLVSYKLPKSSEHMSFNDIKSKKNVSYIHIGTPLPHVDLGEEVKVGKKLKKSKKSKMHRDTVCIQMGDSLRRVDEICDLIRAEYEKHNTVKQEVVLMADERAHMGIIEAVRRELRRSNVVSKIYYATCKSNGVGNVGFITEIDYPSWSRYEDDEEPKRYVISLQPSNRSEWEKAHPSHHALCLNINREGQILICEDFGEQTISTGLDQVKGRAKEYILKGYDYPEQRKTKSDKQTKIELADGSVWDHPVSKAVIYLMCEDRTDYGDYISVLDQLTGVVNDIRNDLAMSKFGKSYYELSGPEKGAILKVIPHSYYETEQQLFMPPPPQKTEIKIYSDVLEIITNEERLLPISTSISTSMRILYCSSR